MVMSLWLQHCPGTVAQGRLFLVGSCVGPQLLPAPGPKVVPGPAISQEQPHPRFLCHLLVVPHWCLRKVPMELPHIQPSVSQH